MYERVIEKAVPEDDLKNQYNSTTWKGNVKCFVQKTL